MDLTNIKELDLDKGKSKFYKEEVFNLYYRTLCNSNSWDVGLGYFSLSSLKLLAYPLSKFIINNNGKIRVYCNERISENDYQVLSNTNYNLKKLNVFKDLIEMKNALEGKNSELFSQCISYLIHNDLLELKVLINSSNSRGISHHKNSIFKDSKNNIVVLSGSANASEQAFLFNREDTNAFCSFWNERSTTKNINATIEEFEKTFNHGDEDWKILEIKSNELKDKLNEIGFRKIEVSSLKHEMDKYIKKNHQKFSREIQEEIITELSNFKNEPHFPSFGGKNSEPRQYQIDAYNAWIENKFKGIFAMATGTGKTVTSLNCILQEYKKSQQYKFIVLVPTRALVEQWEDEIQIKFNFQNLISISSKYFYQELAYDDCDENSCILLTYATFKGKKFQEKFRRLNHLNKFTLIADECHNMGSQGFLKVLDSLDKMNNRIGLSATPSRYFDEFGEKEVYNFFNIPIVAKNPNFTFSFSISEAINAEPDPFLCPYIYRIKFVELEKFELEEYRNLTKKLARFIDKNGQLKKSIEVEKLLKIRKDIIKKAKNKKNALLEIIDEIGKENFKYSFVYVPEGKEKDYSETDSDWDNYDQSDLNLISDYTLAVNEKYNNEIGIRHFTGATKDRQLILNDFETGRIDSLFAMKCLDEGVDIPRTEIAIFCSSTGNPRQYVQRRGRVLRLHKQKKIATIYDMIVIPKIDLSNDNGEYSCEKGLVEGEVRRLIEFAKDSKNLDEILQNNELISIADHYEINLINYLN